MQNLDSMAILILETISLMSQKYPIKHENPALLVVLILVTCGIYYFILLYRWIAAINDASDKPLVDPAVGIILSIVTCGIATIYYEYEIVARAEKIARKPLPEGVVRSPELKAPASNLKEIVLFGSIASFVLSLFSVGFLLAMTILFTLWLTFAIQQALEYTFAIPQE